MNDLFDDPVLVVIGAARGTATAVARLLQLLPLPVPAPVVVAIQGARAADVAELLSLAPPELRLLSGPQPLLPGGVWLAPPGHDVLVDGELLLLHPPGGGADRPTLATLFASAARRRALGVLVGDTGKDGVAAAAAFADAPLLRLDPMRVPEASYGGCVDRR